MTDKRDIVQNLRDDAAGMISAATEQRQYYAVLSVYAMTCLEAAHEIEQLRALITEWADAEDLVVIDSDLRLYAAYNNLRKAVGR